MVCSLDGFIATHDGGTQWMEKHTHYDAGEDLTNEEIEEFLANVDCYLMGSRTYEHACELGWPYGDKPVYVTTSRKMSTQNSSVHFVSGDLTQIMVDLRSKYSNIWMVGGAALTKSMLQRDLADEIVITVMPVLLGEGKLFFDYVGSSKQLELVNVRTFNDASVESTYKIKKGSEQ